MKRDITAKLWAWKNSHDRKPLLLTGVRQCGKTYSLKAFGQEAFEDTAYFNFEEDTALQAIFEADFKTGRILDELGNIIRGKPIIPGKTLLILDEIQACPRALTSLKYFCENQSDLHLIAAGSLLGVAIGQADVSFPVGKVNRLRMYPMTFTEFVRADDGEKYIEGLRKLDLSQEISTIYTVPLTRYLKLYYMIGGMPEVVRRWTETHQLADVMAKQDEILQDYADDFGKHAPLSELPRIRLIWDSIPSQLAKENNKFIFSRVKAGARAKDLEDAMKWLVDAGLIYQVHLVENPEIPLSGEADYSAYKVYMADVGLLCRRSNIHYRTLLEEDELFIHTKGALTENYVLTQLQAMTIPAWYWRSDANAEVDFITDDKGLLLPIEVKSADNTKAKSLRLFCSRYHPAAAVKTSLKNAGVVQDQLTQLWSLPLYSLFRLPEIVGVTVSI